MVACKRSFVSCNHLIFHLGIFDVRVGEKTWIIHLPWKHVYCFSQKKKEKRNTVCARLQLQAWLVFFNSETTFQATHVIDNANVDDYLLTTAMWPVAGFLLELCMKLGFFEMFTVVNGLFFNWGKAVFSSRDDT